MVYATIVCNTKYTMASDDWDNARWVAWVLPLGVLLLSYYYASAELGKRWNDMKTHSSHIVWAAAAGVGLVSTVLAFVQMTRDGLDAYGWVGFGLYFVGEVGWAFSIKNSANLLLEPLALLVTSLGLVIWATATVTPVWSWTAPVVISAVYHVTVDLCWYMSFHAKTSGNLKDVDRNVAKFAAWSGYLAMLHFAFASFITVENMRATNAFTPDIRLTYNRWVRTGDSCAESDCVVFPVFTNYGAVDVGVVVALFSWISGTNHALTYLGLHAKSEYVATQVGLALSDNNQPHCGNTLRTVDWALSASLMMAVNLFLYETPGNITSMLATIAATGLVMIVGWSSEVMHGYNITQGKWGLFTAASVLFAVLWVPLVWILAILPDRPDNERYERNGTLTLDNVRSPPVEVYFFISWLIGTFFLFPIVHLFKLWGSSDVKRSFKYEVWFAILSFVSKLPLLAVFYGGILSRRNTIESDKTPQPVSVLSNATDGSRESGDVFMSIGVGVGISVISAIAMLISWQKVIRGVTSSYMAMTKF